MMNRSELVKTLELVAPALAANQLVPIFTAFTFKDKNVTAYNDVIGINAKCAVEEKPFAVNGAILRDLLKASSAEEINITLDKESLKIKAGKSNLKMPYFSEEDFIFTIPEEKYNCTIAEADEDLIKGIEACLTTTSKDNTMPALMGVCFNFGPSGVTLFSCDGDAITRYKVDGGFKGKGVFTVPNDFCEALVKIHSETGSQKISVKLNDDWIKANFENYDIQVYGRIIKNPDLMDHATLIKDTIKGNNKTFNVPLSLPEALDKAFVIADPESKPTIISIEKGVMTLFTESSIGEIKDTINFKEHENVEALVHVQLLQRSLKICSKMAVHNNCTVYTQGEKLLQVVSNVGE